MNLTRTSAALLAANVLFITVALAALAAPSTADDTEASSGGVFNLTWHTIDGGGGTSTGGGFELAGSIGQHDAGGPMTGGDFELNGGFWAAASDTVEICPADITGDSQVNVFDMLALLGEWGPCPGCTSDLNGDSTVNVFDMLALLGAWGPCP